MTRIEGALAEKKLSAQMLLQVHDELIFLRLDQPLLIQAFADLSRRSEVTQGSNTDNRSIMTVEQGSQTGRETRVAGTR
jgi:hypothetical protein